MRKNVLFNGVGEESVLSAHTAQTTLLTDVGKVRVRLGDAWYLYDAYMTISVS